MKHTNDCLRFGKSIDCPCCQKIHSLIEEGHTKKEIREIMRKESQAHYFADLHNIRVTIAKINV